MSTPLLSVRGVTTYYGKIIALRGVDVDVNEGEIVTLIGANGAGKSTLMMTICGNPRARDGSIVFNGIDITAMPTHEIMRMAISQAPEGRRIFPRMTVLENLQMGAAAIGVEHFDEDLERLFGIFPLLKKRASQRGGTLSGGEQQMLAIARALISRPRLLLLDEPSLGLAPMIVRQIFSVLVRSQQARRPHRLPRRAGCAPRAEARPSRLCHGQRADHHERHRQGTAGARGRARGVPGGRTMTGVIWEIGPAPFLLVTVALGGGAAYLTGRAVALTWRTWAQLGGYLIALTFAVRFIHYALFGGTLLSLHYALIDLVVLGALAALGQRLTRRRQMLSRYGWLYAPGGLLSWTRRSG